MLASVLRRRAVLRRRTVRAAKGRNNVQARDSASNCSAHYFRGGKTGQNMNIQPEWISSGINKQSGDYDARFSFRLTIAGVDCRCEDLLFEQFVSGGFTISHEDGSQKHYGACDTMKQINSASRRFGQWCDDLLPGWRPGPHHINAYPFASCKGAITREPFSSRATMRGPSARPSGSSYYFDDAPGFARNFGDRIGGKAFTGINWSAGIQHKIWCRGREGPIFSKIYQLTGKYNREGIDTRSIS